MKTKFIILLSLICFMANSQPIMTKRYDGKGSCLMINNVFLDYKKNTTLIRVAVYEDYSAMRRGDNAKILVDVPVNSSLFDLQDSMISYLTKNVDFYKTATLTTVHNLPPAPDTTWVNISPCIFDTTIHRKVGVYSIADDSKAKQAVVTGIVKHYKNDTLISKYTQEIIWQVDNTDSVYDANLGWVHTYDYLRGAQKTYGWTDDETVQYGISWFDPNKINDRLNY